MTTQTSIKYRKDIDGLRAIAILYVLGYHLFPYYFKSGFVGVDIFFVISGFLITSVIISDLAAGKHSFRHFYKRRILRLFPALAFVLLFCFATGWIFLTADEFKQLNQHITAGSAFVSNLFQLQQVGYFEAASETKPLLHLWSLGIEEQFYIIWPILIFLCWSRRRLLGIVLLMGGLLSFFYSIRVIHFNVTEAFYSPFPRLWELLVGGLLAYLAHCAQGLLEKPGNIQYGPYTIFSERLFRNCFSIVGLILLTLSLICIKSEHNFPGWWALLPTLGTFFLLSAGPKAWINRVILSHPVLVFIGMISYPLYLWHWPLISLAHILTPNVLTTSIRITIGMTSFVLAYLTYRYIEAPFRFGSFKTNTGTGSLVLVMSVIIGLGVTGFMTNGFPLRDNKRSAFDHYFENSPPDYTFMKEHGLFEAYRDECNFYDTLGAKVRDKIGSNCYTPSSKQVVFIWGDSHAQQLYYGLSKTLPSNTSILQVTSSGCWPHLEPFAVDQFLSCNLSNRFALEQIKRIKPDIVILAQIREHENNNYKEIVEYLKALGVKDVFVVGPVPQWNPYLYKVVLRNFLNNTPRRISTDLIDTIFTTDNTMKDLFKNSEHVHYISPTSLQCNTEGCIIFLQVICQFCSGLILR